MKKEKVVKKKQRPASVAGNGGTRVMVPGPGRNPLSEIERKAREASRREIAETWEEIKSLDLPALQSYMQSPGQPAVKVMMASAIIKGIKSGDLSELHRFYDRLLGRPTQRVETTSDEPTMFLIPGMVKDS
jgi:hypothetical protein